MFGKSAKNNNTSNAVSTKCLDYARQLEAINKSMAVISFTPEGIILDANDNFLNTVGYTLGEIKGNHHKIFCQKQLVESQEYADFWNTLKRGTFVSKLFKRVKKMGILFGWRQITILF